MDRIDEQAVITRDLARGQGESLLVEHGHPRCILHHVKIDGFQASIRAAALAAPVMASASAARASSCSLQYHAQFQPALHRTGTAKDRA